MSIAAMEFRSGQPPRPGAATGLGSRIPFSRNWHTGSKAAQTAIATGGDFNAHSLPGSSGWSRKKPLGNMAVSEPNSAALVGPSVKNDMMIAAIALTLGHCTVVTMDGDLSAVPGLTVENWATPVAGSTP